MFNNFGKLLETRCWPTDRPTNRPTNIRAYRAAIAAKNDQYALKYEIKQYIFVEKKLEVGNIKARVQYKEKVKQLLLLKKNGNPLMSEF